MLPEGFAIRDVEVSDAAALADAYRRNRAHLAPWEPSRTEAFFTEQGQAASVREQLAGARQGLSAAWVIMRGGQVVGRINLNNVVRGVLQSASIGYWVDVHHLGRGLATEAVEFACKKARDQGLHRVEAGTLVHNSASQRVLERCGFEVFGFAPRFLFIAGTWQDHRLYQRILHDGPP